MHPEVLGKAGEICPRCRMALVRKPSTFDRYGIEVATEPKAPVAGAPTRIRLMVRAADAGSVVKEFELVHERLMHLFVVSHDLSFFAHVHPDYDSAGYFEQTVTLPSSGAYRLIADFAPTGGIPQFLEKTLVTAGYTGPLFNPPQLTPDAGDAKTIDHTRVRLFMTPAIAGIRQSVVFELRDPASDTPVVDLEPFLQAPAHLLLVSNDLQTANHVHPAAGLTDSNGPRLAFQLLFPRAGTYRLWLQFQRHGHVVTVPFTVSVEPAE